MKNTLSDNVFDVINHILLILIAIVCLYPMWHVLMASISRANLLMSHSGILLKPLDFNIESYKAVFRNATILSGYRNTLIILCVGLCLNVVLTCFGAYFLSLKDVVFKKAVMVLIIITMYFNGGIVPTYLTIRMLGLYNSLWAIILPASINTFNLIMLRTAFCSIPQGICESAEIDGANDWLMLIKIYVPLSIPTIAVILLYYGVGHWNSWFNAALYLNDKTKYPLQLVLREILIQNEISMMQGGVDAGERDLIAETIKYATIIVATVPILCIYPLIQKYFEKGVMMGALKG